MAWALTERAWGWSKRGGEKIPPKYWEKKVKALSEFKEANVLISSEFFSELDGEKIRKIRTDFQDWDVQVLFTLRPLAKLLPSTYQQYLKYGTVAEYEEWLHSILDEPGKSKINPTFWKRHAHGKVIARWADIFGKESVSVIIVNEAEPTFLFKSIDEYLGLPLGTLKSADTGSNRSLTVEEIALLLEINRQFPKERDWKEYEVFIRSGYIRQLTDHIAPSAENARLLTPRWAIDKANEIGREIRDEVKKLSVKVIGDLESLGDAMIPEGHTDLPTKIDIPTVAASMLVFNRETVAKFPASWVQNNLLKRYKKKLRLALKRMR